MPRNDDFLRPAAKDRMNNSSRQERSRSRSPVSPNARAEAEGEQQVRQEEEEEVRIVVDDAQAAEEEQPVGLAVDVPSSEVAVVPQQPEPQPSTSNNEVALVPGPLGSPRAGFRGDTEMVPVQQPEAAQLQVALPPPARPKPKSTSRDNGERVTVLSNFIKVMPMNNTHMHNYHVGFEPNIESASMRRRLFHKAFRSEFEENHVTYDGMFDARSSFMIAEPTVTKTVTLRDNDVESPKYQITVRRTGIMPWGNNEMLRIYNLNFKTFFRLCGLFEVTTNGAYLHPDWCMPVGRELAALQGFRTSTGVHEDNQVFVQLEFVSKLLQQKNLLQTMNEMRRMGGNVKETIHSQLAERNIVTSYNKVVYTIIEFNFNLSPQSTFFHKKLNREMSYIEYYQLKYGVHIQSPTQPLILVSPYRKNKKLVTQAEKAKPKEASDIYVVPELCNLAGMTELQRADTRLKTDLIRASQISPNDRIKQMRNFFNKLFSEEKIKEILKKMKYDIERKPVHIQARVMPHEHIGIGEIAMNPNAKLWPHVDQATGGFEKEILKSKLMVAPKIENLFVLITKADADNEKAILKRLSEGFTKVGLLTGKVDVIRMVEGDQGHHFTARLREIEAKSSTAVLIIIPRQNKDKYDTVKKTASAERGIVTQVVTSKLILDDRKCSGACVKIAIQVAAKMGGEPWFVNIPIQETMICGYDTYTDTANKCKTFGAFVASMNAKYSKWWSKANDHTTDEQMSANLRENLRLAITKWHEANNGKYPKKIFIYRDGASDGQLKHVDSEELEHIKRTCAEIDAEIKLAFIIVNKKVGARFYLKRGENYVNPIPGTCIDSVVTKADRFDFYLISQSTRHGTISPTYYNVLYDNTLVSPGNHQMLAFKLCLAYYNWTGTVRVPATCQYAHKLAQLCGETLHQVPTNKLEDRLHYL